MQLGIPGWSKILIRSKVLLTPFNLVFSLPFHWLIATTDAPPSGGWVNGWLLKKTILIYWFLTAFNCSHFLLENGNCMIQGGLYFCPFVLLKFAWQPLFDNGCLQHQFCFVRTFPISGLFKLKMDMFTASCRKIWLKKLANDRLAAFFPSVFHKCCMGRCLGNESIKIFVLHIAGDLKIIRWGNIFSAAEFPYVKTLLVD